MENLEKVGSSIRFAAIAVSGDPGMIHDMNTIQEKCKWKHKCNVNGIVFSEQILKPKDILIVKLYVHMAYNI